MLSLTSSTISKRTCNKLQRLFLQIRQLLKCFDLCKQKIKRKLKRKKKKKKKKLGGVSLLFEIKLNEFHICKQYCQVLSMEQTFSGKVLYKES